MVSSDESHIVSSASPLKKNLLENIINVITMSRAWWTSRIIFCFIVLQVVVVRARTDTLPKEQVVDQPAPIVEQPHAPTSSNVAVAGVSCECQLFIQSWKTSNIIRLHMGKILFPKILFA